MKNTRNHSLHYLAPLDGIRAIAIIGVLIFHISPSALRGGFTGVDVFFVLSGFLITSVILKGTRDEHFSFQEFYLRRIQRLLPNVIVMVSAVLIFWNFFFNGMARSTGKHAFWTLFNGSNIFIWRYLGGYWGDSAEWAPLTHTWSLGVEEQFYLLFPSFLLLLLRYQAKRLQLWLTAVMVLSFGLCIYGSYAYPVATFYNLPTRIWELLLGVILASCQTIDLCAKYRFESLLPFKARRALGWVGLGEIIVGFILIDERSLFPGWVSLIPTTGTILLLLSVADEETMLSRLLSSRFMVGTGKLSYSLYLWHWPLIVIGKMQADIYGFHQLTGTLIGGGAGIVLGCVAWYCVEQPLRKTCNGRTFRFVVIVSGFILAILYSEFVSATRLVADPFGQFDTPTFSGCNYNCGVPLSSHPSNSFRYYDVNFPGAPLRSNNSWRNGGIIHPYGSARPQVVVLGSSHALMYSRLIDEICRELDMGVAFLGVDGGAPALFETNFNPNFIGPFSTALEAREFDVTRLNYLFEWQPKVIFVIDRWDKQMSTSTALELRLRGFLGQISPIAARIIFVTQVPVHRGGDRVNLREIVSARMSRKGNLPRLSTDSKDDLRKEFVAKVESFMGDFHSLRVLRADVAFYLEDGSIRYSDGRKFFYADDDHLTDEGSEVVRDIFLHAIKEAQ